MRIWTERLTVNFRQKKKHLNALESLTIRKIRNNLLKSTQKP